MCVWTGKAKTKEARQTIINPDWNFEKMGIGGLDKEFSDIFRRAFASRVFPPDIVEQMGERPPLLFFCDFTYFQDGKLLYGRLLIMFGPSPSFHWPVDFFYNSQTRNCYATMTY